MLRWVFRRAFEPRCAIIGVDIKVSTAYRVCDHGILMGEPSNNRLRARGAGVSVALY
jgi:hypothetical protein